ncbi:MAG: nitrate reductase molybdenum cofactor assembly chaperone [Gaiellaceae bacterium]
MKRRGAPPYKLISVLLRYPDERVVEAREEILAAIDELPGSPAKAPLERFAEHLAALSPLELAQAYVETFDLHRRTSLHLTYYLHGDTRKRGMALLRLKHLYREAGLETTTGELPDYLPLVLEFASLAPAELATTLLREQRPALELLRSGLEQAESPYAALLEALCRSLPRMTPLEKDRIHALADQGPPAEQVGLEPFAPPEVVPGSRV